MNTKTIGNFKVITYIKYIDKEKNKFILARDVYESTDLEEAYILSIDKEYMSYIYSLNLNLNLKEYFKCDDSKIEHNTKLKIFIDGEKNCEDAYFKSLKNGQLLVGYEKSDENIFECYLAMNWYPDKSKIL